MDDGRLLVQHLVDLKLDERFTHGKHSADQLWTLADQLFTRAMEESSRIYKNNRKSLRNFIETRYGFGFCVSFSVQSKDDLSYEKARRSIDTRRTPIRSNKTSAHIVIWELCKLWSVKNFLCLNLKAERKNLWNSPRRAISIVNGSKCALWICMHLEPK